MIENREERTQFFKEMNIIYFALVAGQIMFFLVAFFIIKDNTNVAFGDEQAKMFSYFLPIVVIAIIPLGYVMYSKLCRGGKQRGSLEEKLTVYRSAVIIKLALIEAAGFLCLVFYILTASNQFLILFAIVIVAFLINKPSKHAMIRDLNLSTDESEKVINEM